jgi:hypothetical protein
MRHRDTGGDRLPMPPLPALADDRRQENRVKLRYDDKQHAYWLDGRRCKGVTTVAKIPEDTYRLSLWSQRQVAIGVATDGRIYGILWTLAICVLGSPFACLWLVLRVWTHKAGLTLLGTANDAVTLLR